MKIAEKLLPHLANFLIQEHNPNSNNYQSQFSPERLKELVEKYSFERNFNEYPKANKIAKNLLIKDFERAGYELCIYNDCDNIFASRGEGRKITITGHYDGPHNSPGADDNGSALAVMIHLAETLPRHLKEKVNFIGFNREECNILGSKLLLEQNVDDIKSSIAININLEMVGYFTDKPNSQEMPEGFPTFDKGNFLALVGNNGSGNIIKKLVQYSKQYDLSLPLKGFNVPFGLEFKLPELERLLCSDHSRFWEHNIPAVMLTDTSDYRNKNYHLPSDLPHTLNYESMRGVVDLLYRFIENYEV